LNNNVLNASHVSIVFEKHNSSEAQTYPAFSRQNKTNMKNCIQRN